jgi:Spy/CpxP family protein refolding chaperone
MTKERIQMITSKQLASALAAMVLAAGMATAARADHMAGQRGMDDGDRGMGPGMMGGYGMGPGMMGGYGMGPGMMGGYGMGPGMMGGYGMGPGMMGGYGMGPGMMGGYGMGPGMMGPGMMMPYSQLDLSDAQRAKLNGIRADMRQKQQVLGKQMRSERTKLQELYEADKPDRAAIRSQQRKILGIQRQMMDNWMAAQNQMDDLLTDEQRDELRDWERGWMN